MAATKPSTSFSSQDDVPLLQRKPVAPSHKADDRSNGQKRKAPSKPHNTSRPGAAGRSVAGSHHHHQQQQRKVRSPGGSYVSQEGKKVKPRGVHSSQESKPKIEPGLLKKEEEVFGSPGPIVDKSGLSGGKSSQQIGSPGNATSSKPKRVPRPKKEYDMPGQKKDTPAETDPLRKFYSSLRTQRPDSELARKWCVEHGLETRDFAEAWLCEQGAKKRSLSSPNARGAGGGRNKVRSPRNGLDMVKIQRKSNPKGLTGRGVASIHDDTARTIQKRPPKRRIRSPEGALPPKEIVRSSKSANGGKLGDGRLKGASRVPSKRKLSEGGAMERAKQPRIAKQKQEDPKKDADSEIASWETSDEDVPLSRRRLAA